jgi:uncharacterized membrane protein YedE/YeeE
MTRPDVVLAFLDVAGAWDPSLLFVMAGAAGTFGLFYWTSRRRGRPLFGSELRLRGRIPIDRGLVAGTAAFGVGWGLVGVCPGPAITSLASGAPSVVAFVAAMLIGIKTAEIGRGQPPRAQVATNSGSSE